MFIKNIVCFFERIERDIRLFNLKPTLITSAVTFAIGFISWLIGGRADRASIFYMFPKSAISIGFMYFLWGISFAFIGLIIGGMLFGCEKYRKREATKATIFVVVSFIFSICIYPLFFKCMSPFITTIFILITAFFCFLAIMSSIRLSSLWSLCLMAHLLWLVYNLYIAFSVALIN